MLIYSVNSQFLVTYFHLKFFYIYNELHKPTLSKRAIFAILTGIKAVLTTVLDFIEFCL